VKKAVDDGLSTSLADGLLLERNVFVESFRSQDSRIGVESFLANGPGKAQFTGR
jgi:enoyl-CoA hydratase